MNGVIGESETLARVLRVWALGETKGHWHCQSVSKLGSNSSSQFFTRPQLVSRQVLSLDVDCRVLPLCIICLSVVCPLPTVPGA